MLDTFEFLLIFLNFSEILSYLENLMHAYLAVQPYEVAFGLGLFVAHYRSQILLKILPNAQWIVKFFQPG